MKIKLIVIGKTSSGWLQDGIDVYISRLGHYTGFRLEVVPDVKVKGAMLPDVLCSREAESILKHLDERDIVVLLDESGHRFTSEAFAGQLEKWQMRGDKQLVFVIGGAFGFGASLVKRSAMKVSLSDMTFSHQMVRLIFLEQLYRAFTIIRGEPYHHR
jgi:23S rRNA (pseudouridine1915-N3)-methyltransferase